MPTALVTPRHRRHLEPPWALQGQRSGEKGRDRGRAPCRRSPLVSPASASRPLPQDSQQKRRAEKENGGAAPRSSLHLRGAGCGPEGPRRKVPPANPQALPDLAWGPGQQGRTLLPHDGHPRGHDGSPWSFHGPKPWATLAGGGAGVCLLPRVRVVRTSSGGSEACKRLLQAAPVQCGGRSLRGWGRRGGRDAPPWASVLGPGACVAPGLQSEPAAGSM